MVIRTRRCSVCIFCPSYISARSKFAYQGMHDYNVYRRSANICTVTGSSCIWSLHCRVDRQNPNPSIRLNSFCLLSQTGGVLHLHVAFHPLDKHGGQRIKVGRRVIQMLFPMIQMANNDRQIAWLIFDSVCYLYRTRLLSLYSEHKCTYKKHWRILHTIGLTITELSRLKKKGSKRGRDSDSSNAHCRGNCIPKQPRKFFCRDLSRYLTKTQHSAPCSYRGCALKNVKCPAILRPHKEGLRRFHYCSNGLSSNKTPFLLRNRMSK